MADAGFGGAEISDVHHSSSTGLDPAGHGWGTQAWVDAMQTALERAKARGMMMDFASGPSWPSAVPSITPDSGSAIKELDLRARTITGGQTFSGPAPGAGHRSRRGRDHEHAPLRPGAEDHDGRQPAVDRLHARQGQPHQPHAGRRERHLDAA